MTKKKGFVTLGRNITTFYGRKFFIVHPVDMLLNFYFRLFYINENNSATELKVITNFLFLNCFEILTIQRLLIDQNIQFDR